MKTETKRTDKEREQQAATPDKPRSAYLARKFFPHLGEYHGQALVEQLIRAAAMPNEKADLPPTGARQPRSGTEGGNGG